MNYQEELSHTSDPNSVPIPLGAAVFAFDDRPLGVVAEVAEAHFRVSGSDGPEFWLSKAAIRRAAGIRIDLQFTEAGLEGFKLDEPRASADSPLLDAEMNVFESAEDQVAARERMERGYGTDVNVEDPAWRPGDLAVPFASESRDSRVAKTRLLWASAVALLGVAALYTMFRRKTDVREPELDC